MKHMPFWCVRDADVCALRRKLADILSQFPDNFSVQSNLNCNKSVPRWFMFFSCNTTNIVLLCLSL